MEPTSILESVTEHDVVTVKNPFDEPFIAKVARSVVGNRPGAHNAPTGNSSADAFLQGIQAGISRGGHQSVSHVQQNLSFQPQQILRLPGDVARVVVNQMVREYMQRQSRKIKTQTKAKNVAMLMADPQAYMEVEKLIVQGSESMLSDLSVETVEQRLDRQLKELNQIPETNDLKVEDEQAFPTESGDSGAGVKEASASGRAGSARSKG